MKPNPFTREAYQARKTAKQSARRALGRHMFASSALVDPSRVQAATIVCGHCGKIICAGTQPTTESPAVQSLCRVCLGHPFNNKTNQ
jgi:hypothetical protein